MTDLPPGWERATLAELCEINPRSYTHRVEDGDELSLVRMPAVEAEAGRLDASQVVRYSDVKRKSLTPFQEDDVLFAKITPCMENGKTAVAQGLVGGRAVGSTEFIVLRRKGGISPRYLMYYLLQQHIRRDAERHMSGAVGQRRVPRSYLESLSVPVPPLAEQRRIVAVLEDHLSRINAATTSLQAALRRANSLRRRRLHQLVRPEPHWHNCTLGQVANTVRNGMFVSRPGSERDGVPILRIGAVRALHLDLSDFRYSTKSVDEVKKEGFLLQHGDLLFTRYNGNPEYVGACATIPDNVEALTYPDKLIRVSVDTSVVLPRFIAMLCTVGPTRQVIRSCVKTTAGQTGISGNELKRAPLAFPSLDEQQRRVSVFDTQEEVIRGLEWGLRLAVERGKRLRRSLLAEAFTGRLVAQDPNDEPASELLARIRAERAKQPSQPGTRKPRRTSTKAGRTSTPASAQEEIPL